MTHARRARRVDANCAEIRDAFEKAGCSVDPTNDKWDLSVGFGGLTFLVEVKDGSKPPSRQRLTEREERFWSTWKGGVYLVRNVEDALQCAQTMKRWVGFINEGVRREQRPNCKIESRTL